MDWHTLLPSIVDVLDEKEINPRKENDLFDETNVASRTKLDVSELPDDTDCLEKGKHQGHISILIMTDGVLFKVTTRNERKVGHPVIFTNAIRTAILFISDPTMPGTKMAVRPL